MGKTAKTQLAFRKAGSHDLEQITAMYKRAIEALTSKNIMQWDDIYPDNRIIEDDISKGEMYISENNGTAVAAYTINREYDNEYKNGKWKYPLSSFYIVHRLCITPERQNEGIGTAVMRHIEKWAKDNSAQTIRLDCFTQNPHALRMYINLEYHITGTVTWRKGSFYLMEKRLQ